MLKYGGNLGGIPNFLCGFFPVYQVLQIWPKFIPLALLALVLREYILFVLFWLWGSRSWILRLSLGKGEESLNFRSRLRLVGIPLMDSVMDD